MLLFSCVQGLISPRFLKSLPYHQDQLQDLQGSMQNENAEPLIHNYREFQDDSSRALNKVQGPSDDVTLHRLTAHAAGPAHNNCQT